MSRIVRFLIDGDGKPIRAAVKHDGSFLHEYTVRPACTSARKVALLQACASRALAAEGSHRMGSTGRCRMWLSVLRCGH